MTAKLLAACMLVNARGCMLLLLTEAASVHVVSAGTYAGLVEKLPYLKQLGVNAIELLPVHEFNELEYYAVHMFEASSAV